MAGARLATALALLICGASAVASQSGDKASAPERPVYIDAQGESGVSFGQRMGIGTIDRTPGLDPFRMQEWSEPISDCSNREFRCVAAGDFIIFTPVAPPTPRRVYRYRGRYLRVIDCAEGRRQCTLEIGKDRGAAGNEPLLIYMAQDDRGIASLGFSEVPDDPHVASRQFTLRGSVGLFGSERR